MICIPTTCWVVIDTENYAMCEHGCCRSHLTQSPDEDSIIIPILQMRKITLRWSVCCSRICIWEAGAGMWTGRLTSESRFIVMTSKLVWGLKSKKHNKKFILMKCKVWPSSIVWSSHRTPPPPQSWFTLLQSHWLQPQGPWTCWFSIGNTFLPAIHVAHSKLPSSVCSSITLEQRLSLTPCMK